VDAFRALLCEYIDDALALFESLGKVAVEYLVFAFLGVVEQQYMVGGANAF
jgi:hypothetical protein